MRYLFVILILVIIVSIIWFIVKAFQYPSKIRKAEEFLDSGEYSKASEIIKKILEKKKDYVPARIIRAQLLMKQNQYLMAISEFNNVLSLPDFSKYARDKELQIHYNLAFLYNETKNFNKEIEEYRIILTFNADDLKANHRIGHALYKQHQYKKVKEHLSRVILLDPNIQDCYLPLGVSCFNISDYQKAENYLLKVLTFNGDHTEAEFYLGQIYKMKKDYDTAITMLSDAKRNKNFFIKCLYLLGEIYYELQQYRDAIDQLELGLNNIQDRTEDAHAYRYLLAECYELENKIKEAIHHWTKIVQEDPDYRGVKIKLESYDDIIKNNSLMKMFASSLEELQPVVVEIISSLQYNIISKERISNSEYIYKAYNIKRINDPPLLIAFNRTTREITEGQIIDLYKKINEEKCKSGIYIATSKFSLRAKNSASAKLIDLYDSDYVTRTLEKIETRKNSNLT